MLLLLVMLGAPLVAADHPPYFVIKPYLQIGVRPDPTSLSLLWMTADEDVPWSVSLRVGDAEAKPCALSGRRVTIGGTAFRQFVAVLGPLTPGGPFDYRVSRGSRVVFSAAGTAPPPAGGAFRAVVVGDLGDGSGSERVVAAAVHADAPGLVVIPGDIVYPRGTQLDYLRNLFPVYNFDRPTPGRGVPLMRSVPFVAAPGNHDIPATKKTPINLSREGDALAYYYDWMQPLNGPVGPKPRVVGSKAEVDAFLAAAADRFPRMGNFSFDWGCAHWTIIDSNPYVDWTEPSVRKWLSDDLEAARDARWRLVVFHHPPFQSAKMKNQDQWMRLMVELLEKGRVDIVFNGHLHNYQRSWPLHFEARPQPDGRMISKRLSVAGTFRFDRTFDGVEQTRADGPIYVVSGAGGQPLANTKRQTQPTRWQPFTCRYVADQWSFTDLDATPERLLVRQLGTDGRELDRFTVTR